LLVPPMTTWPGQATVLPGVSVEIARPVPTSTPALPPLPAPEPQIAGASAPRAAATRTATRLRRVCISFSLFVMCLLTEGTGFSRRSGTPLPLRESRPLMHPVYKATVKESSKNREGAKIYVDEVPGWEAGWRKRRRVPARRAELPAGYASFPSSA
jgi:hypothetical protein